MKKQFQSKSVPRGTRTIWRYLGALFILFTFAIGNVWAADPTIGAGELPSAALDISDFAKTVKAGTIDKYKVIPSASGTTATGDPYYVLVSDSLRQEYASKTANLPWVYCKATDGGGSHSMSYADGLSDADKLGFVTATRSIGINSGRYHNYRIKNCTSVTVLNRSNGTKDEKRIWLNVFKYNSLTESFEYQEQIKSAYNSSKDIVVSATLNASDEYVIQITSGSTSNSKAVQIRFIGVAPTSHTVTYKSGDGSGDDVVDDDATVVGGCPSTFSYTGYDFAGWKDGDNNDVEVGDAVTSDMTLTAQWTVHVAKYTVKYMDGTTLLGTEEVNVTEHPAGLAENPKKDCYTFAAWSPALSSVSGEENDEVEVNATWTPVYSSSATLISDAVVSGKPNVNTVFAASNIVSSITFTSDNYEFKSNETKPGYYGYKDKQSGDYMKILVQKGKRAQVLFGNLGADPTITVNGVAKSLDAARATGDMAENTFTWTASAEDALISITMGSGTNTLKKVDIIQLYTATRVDGKSDASGSDANVLETTLPTPTAISGWTFTGWVANADVKAGENTKTAGTVLAAGTYTLLANTTFTAQWTEASSTYDITYSSAHGTAPDAENAASVVLAELSADGWAHKGWTASEDVTVDAATVEAGTLIANGKTVVLASNVTFTAVWKEIFTVTFNSKGGSAVDPIDVEDGASIAAAPADPTKDDYIFLGWSETDGGDVVADITAITISDDKTFYAKWKLDVQVSEIVFSNSFKGWIVGSTVTVFYMAGESAPTIVSYDGKNLKAEGGVVISGDKIIATGTDDSEVEFDLTMTEVTPLATTGAQTFDGTEGYVKTRHAWTADRKWKMSKYAEDGRVARGETSMYIFLGAAESVTFDWGKQQKTNDVAVYVNGTFVKNLGKDNNSAVELTKGNNMVAFYSLQTSGDVWLNGLTVAPWVPVTAVTLKEGGDAISSKEIYAGANFTLTAEVTPDNASDKTITWTSSNNDVATVVNGVVTGVAANATPVTITASTVDGVTATCAVTVTAAPEPCETPTVNIQPAGSAYCAGSEPTLTVVAEVSDEGTLHYAWFKVGETDEAVGSDAASYTVEAAGTYYVIVTNKKDGKLDASVTSDNAVVTLNTPASITTQPTDLKKQTEGANITLSVVAAYATGYQWYSCDNKDKENPSLIAGADEAEYEFAAAAGFFYCEVTGLCGTIESNVAEVTIKRTAGCQYINATSGSQANLADGTIMYACGSDGKLSTGDNFATASANAKGIDADAVGSINKQYCVVKFPVDVEEITLYGYNGSNREINNLCIGDAVGTDIKVNTAFTAYTKSKANDGNERSMTIEFDEPFAKEKYLFIKYNSALEIYRICYTAALVEPKLPTLADQELCASAAIAAFDATITNAAACEGTVSYKWFSTADTETPVATTAEFTPSTDGTYYVVVTHSAAGHITRTVQSDNLTVAHFDALTLVSNSGDVFQHMGTEATLSVVATGKNVAYAWYTCDVDGNNAEVISGASTASYVIASIAEGIQYYKVVISHDCDATTLSHIFKVEGWDQLEQVDVTATTTWDMTNVSANHIELTGSDKNARLLLANIDGVNNTTFNAQALKFEGQHIGRTEGNVKHLAGRYVQFNVTVPGAVFVTFASNGNNARTIAINGKKCARTTSGTAADKYITYALAVEPGSVEIIGYEGESANQYVRISKIEFKAEYSYHRENLNPSYLGTLCWTNNAILGGATLYEFAGKNEYNYLVFDEVEENRLEAGKPYIFMPENGNTEIKVYNTDSEEPLTEDQAPVNHMYGTITGKTLVPGQNDNMYYFSASHIWAVKDFTVNIDIPAYCCYVDYVAVLNGSPAPAPAPGRRRVAMGVQGTQVATGMENLNVSDKPVKMIINGQLFILRGEKMYDAKGQLVK